MTPQELNFAASALDELQEAVETRVEPEEHKHVREAIRLLICLIEHSAAQGITAPKAIVVNRS
jgi:hypothetical protein